MGLAITSIGITVGYAVETAAGTRPTTGYTNIPDIKSIPDFNPEPDMIETTTFAAKTHKTYTPGLTDLGGALSFNANLTNELYEVWQDETSGLMTKYNTAKADGKAVWFCINIPGFDLAQYFTGEPSPVGSKETEVNSVIETDLHIAPTSDIIFATKPTA